MKEAINRQEILNLMVGDAEIVLAAIDAFVRIYPGLMENLTLCVHRSDFNEAQKLAHSLKGALSVFGVPWAVTMLQDMNDKLVFQQQDFVKNDFHRYREKLDFLFRDLISFSEDLRAVG